MKTIQKIILGLSLVGSLASASDGAALYNKCVACHGANAEKKALGKSAVIAGWEESKIITALKGYKDGSYGGPMKGVMKGQVSRLSDADMQALAAFIATKK